MVKIELTKNEYSYLCKASFLPSKFQALFSSGQQYNDRYLLHISEEQADELRDLYAERLQVAGFDENYKLTQEGEILESLIDKFFLG